MRAPTLTPRTRCVAGPAPLRAQLAARSEGRCCRDEAYAAAADCSEQSVSYRIGSYRISSLRWGSRLLRATLATAQGSAIPRTAILAASYRIVSYRIVPEAVPCLALLPRPYLIASLATLRDAIAAHVQCGVPDAERCASRQLAAPAAPLAPQFGATPMDLCGCFNCYSASRTAEARRVLLSFTRAPKGAVARARSMRPPSAEATFSRASLARARSVKNGLNRANFWLKSCASHHGPQLSSARISSKP